jgi:hypothetical protein
LSAKYDKSTWLLLGVFLLAITLRLYIVHTQVPEGMMIDWGDNWSFLTVIEMIKAAKHLPKEDLFFGGIPYVYPPLSLITYTILYMIIPVPYTFLSNNIAPIIGSLTVFGVYLLAHALTKDRWTSVLAAYLTLSAPRFLPLSSIPIPEMFGHLQAPVFMYLVYTTAKSKKKSHAVLSGLAGATLFLNHHLTSAILLLTAVIYLILLTVLKARLVYARLLVVILAVSFLLSSPWWFDTVSKNIMNLVVREQEYAVPPFSDYIQMMSPFTFYVGAIALAYFAVATLWKRDEATVLVFTWSAFTLLATQSRHIVKLLLEEQVKAHPNLLLVLAPIYGERYFNYMGEPWAIMNAMFLAGVFYWAGARVLGKKKTKAYTAFACMGVLLVAYPTLTYNFGIDDTLMTYLNSAVKKAGFPDPHLDGKSWALWRMVPDVNDSAEYKASLWMREHLPENANIVADYPSGEVISAGAVRKIVGGAELRVTVDVVGVYSDILTIYYSGDLNETVKLMKKRDATHVYITERIIRRGWLPITSHSRWPKYSIGSGMRDTNEKKFMESGCFRKVYNEDGIRMYELVC